MLSDAATKYLPGSRFFGYFIGGKGVLPRMCDLKETVA